MTSAYPIGDQLPETARTSRRSLYIQIALLAVCCLLITMSTRAYFMGDTKEYVADILNERGYHHDFWDFGHILWRPLGLLMFELAKPLTRIFVGDSDRTRLIITLISIAWTSSVLCVLLLFDVIRRTGRRAWVAWLVSLAFLTANAFLNYLHTGSSYIPGLTCLLAGIWLLLQREEDVRPQPWFAFFPAALCFAAAVFLWFPYAFVVPAAAMSSLLGRGSFKQDRRVVLWTLGQCIAIGMLLYVGVILGLGIHDVTSVKAWIVSAGHGQIQPRSLIRLAFSFPRAFIYLGEDGVYFKRFLMHDPYAAVPLLSLFRLTFWKIALFYAFVAAVLVSLLRSSYGRRMLLILATAMVPLWIFALFIFQAGSTDIYLPLYPFVFLAAAVALQEKKISPCLSLPIVLCLVSIVVVNGAAMRKAAITEQRERTAARIRDLVPHLKRNSVVMTVDIQEDVSEFKMNFPLDPINLNGDWRNYNVLEIGAQRLANWRQDAAKRALLAWSQGGDVWLSARFLYRTPRPEWNWVEGDDRRIRWTDLPAFFSQFDRGESSGGDDGFVLFARTEKNEQLLGEIAGV